MPIKYWQKQSATLARIFFMSANEYGLSGICTARAVDIARFAQIPS